MNGMLNQFLSGGNMSSGANMDNLMEEMIGNIVSMSSPGLGGLMGGQAIGDAIAIKSKIKRAAMECHISLKAYVVHLT